MKTNGLIALLAGLAFAQLAAAVDAALPTLFVAGDSTAAKSPVLHQEGWAEPLTQYFEASKLNVVNLALGGRSSRTYITEGHWKQLLTQLRPGDFVLIQFGHNDAGALNEEPPGSTRPLRARGTIPGIGDETQEIYNVITHEQEVVHTFGWYLRTMIADARQKGATPILLSLTGRDTWKDGRVECGSGNYRQWDSEVARAANVPLVDLSRILADRYQALGAATVKGFFTIDYLHTNLSGAYFNAAAVVSGLRALPGDPFGAALNANGRAVAPDIGPRPGSVCEPLAN
jgi:lysophospholipase L1-like esterase